MGCRCLSRYASCYPTIGFFPNRRCKNRNCSHYRLFDKLSGKGERKCRTCRRSTIRRFCRRRSKSRTAIHQRCSASAQSAPQRIPTACQCKSEITKSCCLRKRWRAPADYWNKTYSKLKTKNCAKRILRVAMIWWTSIAANYFYRYLWVNLFSDLTSTRPIKPEAFGVRCSHDSKIGRNFKYRMIRPVASYTWLPFIKTVCCGYKLSRNTLRWATNVGQITSLPAFNIPCYCLAGHRFTFVFELR